jgi:phosphoheptose isomerase
MDVSWIAQRLDESSRLKRCLAFAQSGNINRAGHAIAAALADGGKVLLFGNGGSAADAQHIAAEFVGRFTRDRAPLPVLALTTDTSALTAIGNDYGFTQIFARQLRALGRPGDVAVAISTSGRSPNILAGVATARGQALTTIGLTGRKGALLAGRTDIPIVVPSASTARIQECHITIGHILCEMVEALLFAKERPKDAANTPGGMTTSQPVSSSPKVLDRDGLLALRHRWRAQGRVVVWTNGCFDLLHVGHVRSLQAARSLGDVLVVGVNSDDSVRQLKGIGRPIVPALERVEMLSALACVDYLVMFDELTPECMLSRLKPDVHCKGADYAPPHGKPVPESRVVASYGGRIEFLPLLSSHSTSGFIRHIRNRRSREHAGKG